MMTASRLARHAAAISLASFSNASRSQALAMGNVTRPQRLVTIGWSAHFPQSLFWEVAHLSYSGRKSFRSRGKPAILGSILRRANMIPKRHENTKHQAILDIY